MAMYNIMLDADNLIGWNQLQQVHIHIFRMPLEFVHIPPKINQSQGQDMLVGIETFGTLVGDYLRHYNSSEIEFIDENIGKHII